MWFGSSTSVRIYEHHVFHVLNYYLPSELVTTVLPVPQHVAQPRLMSKWNCTTAILPIS
jgi:hypothetical protein